MAPLLQVDDVATSFYRDLPEADDRPEQPVITPFGIKSMTLKDPDGFDLVFHWPVDRR